MKLALKTSRSNFYKKYYQTLNGILGLSKNELNILAEFSTIRLQFPKDMSTVQKDTLMFSSEYRKIVASNLGMSIFNLNNYIKGLKDRQILIKKEAKNISINPGIFIDLSDKDSISVELKFNIYDSNEDT